LRVESYSNNSTNCLAFGGKLPNTIGSGTTAASVIAGYALGIGVTATNTLDISLYTNRVRTALPEGGLGSVALNTWYGLRLEVFSQGATGDRIMCYRESSPGSATWVQIYDNTILAASPSYVAWGGNRKTGFCTLTAHTNAITGYVDGVNFAVGTAV
jgi:hypothetical protein